MAEPTHKMKKSRPKSEVVKPSNVEKEHHKHHKKHHHHRKEKESTKVEDVDSLKKEIESLKSSHQKAISELNEKVAALQKENQDLSRNAGPDFNGDVVSLKNKLEARSDEVSQLQSQIDELRSDNERKEKALEQEFDKYRNLQAQVNSLTERHAQLDRENQDLKNKSQPIISGGGARPLSERSTSGPFSASFRGANEQKQQNQGSTNIPLWKQRELERQREAEEQRERESRAKLQKVQSLRGTREESIDASPITSGFKDPVLNKPSFHHGGVVADKNDEETTGSALTPELTEEEKIAAEMARMNRTLKKGGHAV